MDRNTACKCTFLSLIDITNNIDAVDDLKEATSEQEKETQMLVVVVFSGALHKSELMSSRTRPVTPVHHTTLITATITNQRIVIKIKIITKFIFKIINDAMILQISFV